tara:strand:- start:20537 stop:21412 length:876 start_codon:yes stop_codon:yes gene_type:complete
MMTVERWFFQNNCLLSILLVIVVAVVPTTSFAQQTKEQIKELKAAQNYLSEAQQSIKQDEFATAEAKYRKAISLNPNSETAKYNLGTAYYSKAKNAQAMLRFKQAAGTATTKAEKHRAFHNLGNTFMNEKKYTEAVEAYKNALRNNPNDDETRYNLALAKDMLEKNPPPPEDKNDENQDQNEEQDQENKEQDQQNQDNQDNNNDGEKEDKDEGNQDEEKDEGDKNEDKGKPNKPKEEEGDKPQQQQPVPGQLSPQQVKSLLEAMNNEEKKTQEKINAEKQKGTKVQTDKDW